MVNIVTYCRDFGLDPDWLIDYMYDDDLIIVYNNNHFLVIRDRTKKFVISRFDSFGMLDRYMGSYYGLQKK